jgi:hypothetical protein
LGRRSAKPSELNEAFLVLIAISKNNEEIYLGDDFSLNIARSPRISEVQNIFRAIFKRNDVEKYFISEKLEDTSGLSPREAIKSLDIYKKEPLNQNNLIEILMLLGRWIKNTESSIIKQFIE